MGSGSNESAQTEAAKVIASSAGGGSNESAQTGITKVIASGAKGDASEEFAIAFRFDEVQMEEAWKKIAAQVEASVTLTDEQDTTVDARYWEQLEKSILKGYQTQAKGLAMQVARLELMLNAFTQQVEGNLKLTFRNWSSHFDKRLDNVVNDRIVKVIEGTVNVAIEQQKLEIENHLQQLRTEINQSLETQLNQLHAEVNKSLESKIAAANTEVNKSIEGKIAATNTEIGKSLETQIAAANAEINKSLESRIVAANTEIGKSLETQINQKHSEITKQVETVVGQASAEINKGFEARVIEIANNVNFTENITNSIAKNGGFTEKSPMTCVEILM